MMNDDLPAAVTLPNRRTLCSSQMLSWGMGGAVSNVRYQPLRTQLLLGARLVSAPPPRTCSSQDIKFYMYLPTFILASLLFLAQTHCIIYTLRSQHVLCRFLTRRQLPRCPQHHPERSSLFFSHLCFHAHDRDENTDTTMKP